MIIRVKRIMAISRAESRTTRRLTRYWIFLSLAYLITFIPYARQSYIHGIFSSYSGILGALAPSFLMSQIGLYYSVTFLVGTIFLAFDLRERDKRERVVEVLDSRPYSNLELVFGRFLGIFLSSWIPIVALAIIFEVAGLILMGLGSPVGEPIEFFSLFSFVFLMIVPALSFAIALVFFVTLIVRSRLVSTVIFIVLVGVSIWLTITLPLHQGLLFDIIDIRGVEVSSEIITRFADPEGWIQRFSVLFAAFSLLVLSAALHPRLDGGSRFKLASGGIVVMAFSVFLAGTVYYKKTGDIRALETWKETHAALSHEAVPDLKKLSGSVKIYPGKDLLLDLDITFRAPDKIPLKKALFTLNPGQDVKSALDIFGESISYTHNNGLLELALPQTLQPGEETSIHLTVQGLPDNRFAFLYSAFNMETLRFIQEDVLLLGSTPGIFHKAFVALMPGLRWLPVSGPEYGGEASSVAAVDYFDVDLKVDLPEGWLAAGPGRRYKVKGNNDGIRFRFFPTAPVPEVALIASKFESRVMEVESVTLEILMNKKHIKNLEVLAETRGKIQEWVGDRFREAKEYGLGYPYDALTLVEVPNILRSFGGGWRLDSAMSPPGMLLMREMGFPTARFDSAFREPEKFRNMQGGIQKAKWDRLRNFFMNDFSGGNIISGATRNFFLYQTSAKGPEAPALNYIMETLSNMMITETRSYFTAHMFLEESDLDLAVYSTLVSYRQDRSNRSNVVDLITDIGVTRPEVWDQALHVSLKDIDLWEDPYCTVNVMTLKANAIAQSLLDTLGREDTGQFLASIRKSHMAKSFSLNDILAAGKAMGYDLKDVLGDRLDSTELPGFVCSNAKIYRMTDSEYGNPRYQMLFTIRNDESVSGFFRFVYSYEGEGGEEERIKSDPIHLAGKSVIQFGTIVSMPPVSVLLEPYLSLNRRPFSLELSKPNEEKIVITDPIEGLKEVPYTVPLESFIVVDDLDPGFDVVKKEKDKGLRITAMEADYRRTDQGLPVAPVSAIPLDWSRIVNPGSYGKYRHTLALIGAGEGEKEAVFTTNINQTGKWDLELYIPSRQDVIPNIYWEQYLMPGKRLGTYNLLVTDGNGGQHKIKFDPKKAPSGWNPVGNIDLPKGETTVTISNKTDGDYVVADAIRWSPAAGN